VEEITSNAYGLLHALQMKIRAPKTKENSHLRSKYRHVEDILQAAKEFLPAGCCITLSDKIVLIGDRYYVEATARFVHEKSFHFCEVVGYAREALECRGKEPSQITGSASSYARKYALQGLLAIDNNEDVDDDSYQQSYDDHIHQKSAVYVGTQVQTALQKISRDEAMDLLALLKESPITTDKFLEFFKIEKIDYLDASNLARAKAVINKAIAKQSEKAKLATV
jgi:hypothetical protein